MREELQKIKTEFLSQLQRLKNLAELEELEIRFFGRKAGTLTTLIKGLKDFSAGERQLLGQLVNDVKNALEQAFFEKRERLQQAQWAEALLREAVDVTQPALPLQSGGHLHPNTIIQKNLEDFFTSLGFMIFDGPELESDYYNFSSLNIPEEHPARDSQDTFYLKGHPGWLMRTHTSAGDVRAKQKYGAPLRVISTGKCFRNEATDVRHEHTFYQFQGVVVDEGISFAHLKGLLEAVVRHLYGPEAKLRLRPKYYPFVEPGVNGEVTCFLCQGKGCRVCKQTGWLEIFGAGLIHPHLLREGNIDTSKYQGFAFGLGLTRLVMLKYGIDDIRLLESGDFRFLEQF